MYLQNSAIPPSLQAADRSFLEDLLHYLRQQRKQLDDSRRLLERIEESSIPSTTHIHVDTAESGTLPSPPHAHTGSQATPLTASHTQTPPRSSTQTTPTQSTHATTNTYSFHSERSSVPRTSSSPGMGMGQGKGMGNGSFSETYTYAGPPKPTESGGKAGKVDLSKLYEQCESLWHVCLLTCIVNCKICILSYIVTIVNPPPHPPHTHTHIHPRTHTHTHTQCCRPTPL